MLTTFSSLCRAQLAYRPGIADSAFTFSAKGTLSPGLPLGAKITPQLPLNLATCNYGIFCRTELKLDKVAPLKFRFRLGSMQQADWLESKPGSLHP